MKKSSNRTMSSSLKNSQKFSKSSMNMMMMKKSSITDNVTTTTNVPTCTVGSNLDVDPASNRLIQQIFDPKQQQQQQQQQNNQNSEIDWINCKAINLGDSPLKSSDIQLKSALDMVIKSTITGKSKNRKNDSSIIIDDKRSG
ncbi:hypothetical protein BLA29_013014 [Euroglyphus maynei]|uniref:Uncharacterized protein n=1 Tax=Euroglyphus maynei TaxID=6958 RepID=A0A1Y3B2M3_EURMA|nr:hypothetical protein BLA29_013014 [Euroglyphus maynei]